MCTMWVLGVCTDHDHHHINWALPVRVDAAEDFLKLIKGGARGGQIGPAAMDHLSVGRQSLHSVQVDVRDMQTPKKTHHSQSISCCTQHQSISYIWFQITRLQAMKPGWACGILVRAVYTSLTRHLATFPGPAHLCDSKMGGAWEWGWTIKITMLSPNLMWYCSPDWGWTPWMSAQPDRPYWSSSLFTAHNMLICTRLSSGQRKL